MPCCAPAKVISVQSPLQAFVGFLWPSAKKWGELSVNLVEYALSQAFDKSFLRYVKKRKKKKLENKVKLQSFTLYLQEIKNHNKNENNNTFPQLH